MQLELAFTYEFIYCFMLQNAHIFVCVYKCICICRDYAFWGYEYLKLNERKLLKNHTYATTQARNNDHHS